MIRAFLFDLDGTLVETEKLKALSYAQAALELRPRGLTQTQVLDAFRDVVGRPREEVASALLRRFDLERAAQARTAELNVREPWEAFAQIRLQIYEEMLSDPALLISQRYSHNIELLQQARHEGFLTGIATMSYRPQATRVLKILGLQNELDEVVTREDVKNGKPNPEIYLLLAKKLLVAPQECLVFEDSPSGVKAALAAGMRCIAVTTEFTREQIHAGRMLDRRWVADRPEELQKIVSQFFTVTV